VVELCQPVIDKVHEHEDLHNRLAKFNEEEAKKLWHLENVVFDREGKLDVFEQIHSRITQVESDRLIVE